jgi:hypothetical protein
MGGEIKGNGRGVNTSVIYLIYCKKFCKWHNVPPPQQLKKTKDNVSVVLEVRLNFCKVNFFN